MSDKPTASTNVIKRARKDLRVLVLIREVYAVSGFEMTGQQALDVLAWVDGVDPLRQPHPLLDNRKRFSTNDR